MTIKSNIFKKFLTVFFYLRFSVFLVYLLPSLFLQVEYQHVGVHKNTTDHIELFCALLISLTDPIPVLSHNKNLNFEFCLIIVVFVDI